MAAQSENSGHHTSVPTNTQSPYENLNTNLSQDNPLHLPISDSPGMKLVSDPFDGTGFSNWKRSMSTGLSARNKLGFVDGTLPKPDSTSASFKS